MVIRSLKSWPAEQGRAYTASGREGAVDVEEADRVFDGTRFEGWIDAGSFGVCHSGGAVQI